MFVQTEKFQGSKLAENKAGIYITCNKLPDFWDETENVEKRLAIFHTREIANQVAEAPKWIENNAMDCLVWIINTINNNKKLLYKSERFYEREYDDFAPIEENEAEITELQKLVTVNVDNISIEPVFPAPQENVPGPSGLQQQYEDKIPRWIERLKTKGILLLIYIFNMFFKK